MPRFDVDYHHRDDAIAERRTRQGCERIYCKMKSLKTSTSDAPRWSARCFAEMSRLRGTTGVVQSAGWPARSHSWYAVSTSTRMPIDISDALGLPMHGEEIGPGHFEFGSAPDRLFSAVD